MKLLLKVISCFEDIAFKLPFGSSRIIASEKKKIYPWKIIGQQILSKIFRIISLHVLFTSHQLSARAFQQ